MPFLLSCSGRWERDPERTPLAFHTLKCDLTAMDFDSPARDRQSQPRATPLAGAGPIDSVEAVEYMGLMLHGNTRTLINYFNVQLAIFACADSNENLSPGRRIFDGVVNQVY